jgi:hypothetical protein
LPGFVPWNRLHVSLSSSAPVTVDDVGWTDVRDG